MMQIKGEGTEDIFNGRNTKAARALLPTVLFAVAARKLDAIDAAASVDQLRIPPSNRLEALKGDRTGQHSIRINERYRICFTWSGTQATEVEIVDYH
jgi:proteic killer suppression protein